jgi:hypothetical protein
MAGKTWELGYYETNQTEEKAIMVIATQKRQDGKLVNQ